MNFSLKKNFRNSKEFKEAGNTTVYATIHVMKEGSAITLVSHELDGDWQFMGDEALQDFKKVGMLVTLDEVIKTDRSVLELADLPMGIEQYAKRKKINGKLKK